MSWFTNTDTFGSAEGDVEKGSKTMPMSNGGANNGSSAHILDTPVIVNVAANEGMGMPFKSSKGDFMQSSSEMEMLEQTQMNTPGHNNQLSQRAVVSINSPFLLP